MKKSVLFFIQMNNFYVNPRFEMDCFIEYERNPKLQINFLHV